MFETVYNYNMWLFVCLFVVGPPFSGPPFSVNPARHRVDVKNLLSSDLDDDDVHYCKTRSYARRSVDRSNSWCADDKRTGRRNSSVRREDDYNDDDDVDDNLNDGNHYPRRRKG